MADKVTKSLDDIIKDNKANRAGNKRQGGPGGRRGGRGGSAAAGGGAGGRFRGASLPRRQNGGGGIQKRRSGASLSPRKAASSINEQWTHDLFQGAAPGGGATKLMVSNLDFGVNDNDIQNLFQEFGRLKKAAVHYDRSARSLGTAEVIFDRRADAIRAMTHYNGVSLDGRPMKIEVVGATAKPVAAPAMGGGSGGNPRRSVGNGGGGNRSFRGGNRGGRGGGGARGGRREPKQQKTAEELDAELEAHQKLMETDQ